MKNKEIEELLNDIKTHDYKVINKEDYVLLLSYIEQLEEELKYSIGIVQHNQIVTKLSKEKKQLENNRDKAIKYLNQPYRDNFDYSKAELINILESDEQ